MNRSHIRFEPSLLDRLNDNDRGGILENETEYKVSSEKLIEIVKRDLSSLLNSACFERNDNLLEFPEVRSSVLNYGMEDFTGNTSAINRAKVLQSNIREAITNFEPRILSESVNVEVKVNDEVMSQRQIVIHIEGMVWAEPFPINLEMRTELDVETGRLSLSAQ